MERKALQGKEVGEICMHVTLCVFGRIISSLCTGWDSAKPGRKHQLEITSSNYNFSSPSEGFPDSSVGKESACNAGDPSSIPESGRSAGEGIGYPFQYSWASLVAQVVQNPPAMWETWVQSMSWEDPLEKGMATHSSNLAWRILLTV